MDSPTEEVVPTSSRTASLYKGPNHIPRKTFVVRREPGELLPGEVLVLGLDALTVVSINSAASIRL